MNNDEQMIALLTSISSDLTEMKQDITGMKEDISGLKKGQAEMKQQLIAVAETITTVQKNEQEHFEILNAKDSELEKVAMRNSYDIALLRAVK